MRSILAGLLLGAIAAVPAGFAAAQSGETAAAPQSAGPADLCQELLAHANAMEDAERKKASEAAATSENAPPNRRDGENTGTQGGGSTSSSSSADTSAQSGQPPTTPTAPAAAPEAAASPHASGSNSGSETAQMTPQQIREKANSGDSQVCRGTIHDLRRAGVELPAALIALAAYDPEAATR